MRLNYAIMNMSYGQMKEIAKVLNMSVLPKARDQAAATLLEKMTSEEGFRALYQCLDDEEKRLYRILFFEMVGDDYSCGIVRSRLAYVMETVYGNSKTWQTHVDRLVQLGLLSPMQVWYSGEGYEIPDLLLPLVTKTFVHEIENYDILNENPEQKIIRNTRYAFTHDLIRLASMAVKAPFSMTKTGVIYKRELNRIKTVMRLYAKIDAQSPGDWEGVPFSVYLAFRSLEDLGVWRFGPGYFHVAGEGLELLLENNSQTLREQLFEGIGKYLKGGNVNIFQLLNELITRHAEKWIQISEVISLFLAIDLHQTVTWASSYRLYIDVLSYCGFIDIGEEEGKEYIRLSSKDNSTVTGWYIQPNMDIMLEENASIAMHFLLNQIAEIKQVDEMSIYTLKKATLLELCDRGWKFEEIIAAFERYAATPISPVVIRQIRDYIAEYNRAVLWDSLLIRFEKKEYLEMFVHHKKAKNAIVDRLGEEAVIIKRSMEKEVRDILLDIGCPAPGGTRMPPEDRAFGHPGGRNARSPMRQTKADEMILSRIRSANILEQLRKE